MTATLAPPREPGSPASASSRRLAERVFRVREFGIVAVLIVFVAITAAIQPRFLSITNIQFVLVDATIFALLALGETIVVISRNVDLSVGSVLGISAFLTAQSRDRAPSTTILFVPPATLKTPAARNARLNPTALTRSFLSGS